MDPLRNGADFMIAALPAFVTIRGSAYGRAASDATPKLP
jgi:hypothetical protein